MFSPAVWSLIDSGEPLEIVSREGWQSDVDHTSIPGTTPVNYVMFSNTEVFRDRLKFNCPSYYYNDTRSNIEKLTFMAQEDRGRHDDLRYNFIIGADGKVYEGLGWGVAPGLPRNYVGINCILIGYMDPMPGNQPSAKMLETRHKLIEYGIRNKFISPRVMEMYVKQRAFWNAFDRLLKRN